jgi:hypothetical protein
LLTPYELDRFTINGKIQPVWDIHCSIFPCSVLTLILDIPSIKLVVFYAHLKDISQMCCLAMKTTYLQWILILSALISIRS